MTACDNRLDISIVMPTYNYGRYLSRALTSVLGQIDDRCEVIVVDDGSTDDTWDVVAGYAHVIRYVRQEHAGPYVACRRGFELSRGRWIQFLDADDRVREGYYTAMRKQCTRTPQPGVIFPRIVNVREDRTERSSPAPRLDDRPMVNLRAFLRHQLRPSAGGALFRHDVVALLRIVSWNQLQAHGFDQVLMAVALGRYPAALAMDAVLEVHDHAGRLRDDAASFRATAHETIETLFDSDLLPHEARPLRRVYEARLMLNRARLVFRSRDYADAARTYGQACVRAPLEVMRQPRHLWRGVRSLVLAPLPGVMTKRATCEGRSSGLPLDDPRAFQHDPMGFLMRCADERGDAARLTLRPPTLLLNDPCDVRHVLATHDANYRRDSFDKTFDPVFAGSLFTSAQAAHRRDRKQLTPPFQARRMDGLIPMVNEEVRLLMNQWGNPAERNLMADMMLLSVRIAGRAILGEGDSDRADRLFRAIKGAHLHASSNWHRPVFMRRLRRAVSPRRHLRYLRHAREIDGILNDIIASRRSKSLPASAANDTSSSWTDLLTILIRCQAEAPAGRPARWVRDQAAALFLAAYDGVANAMAWALYHISLDDEVAQRIRDEVHVHIRDRQPHAEDLPMLTYTRAALDEAMRLHPSPWLLWRRAMGDDVLPGGETIAKGSRVLISPYVLHRREKLFPDPLRFDPARFLGDAVKARPPYSYIPFGGGPRLCLGEPMARLIGVVTIAQLVGRFHLEPATREPIEQETLNGFSAQPRGGRIPMRITRRVYTGSVMTPERVESDLGA